MLLPSLHFSGQCAQAIALYEKAFGAQVKSITYYKDAPLQPGMCTPQNQDLVMHCEMVITQCPVTMCDVPEESVPGNLYVLLVTVDTAAEATTAFDQLAQGGKVFTPLGPQFWSPLYGDLEDQFGVHWQIMCGEEPA